MRASYNYCRQNFLSGRVLQVSCSVEICFYSLAVIVHQRVLQLCLACPTLTLKILFLEYAWLYQLCKTDS